MAYCHYKTDKNITVYRALRNFSISCVEVKMAYSTFRTLSGRFRPHFSPCPDPEHFRGGVADEKISW